MSDVALPSVTLIEIGALVVILSITKVPTLLAPGVLVITSTEGVAEVIPKSRIVLLVLTTKTFDPVFV